MTASETVIDFGKLIAPVFYPVHMDIKNGSHTYYDLYGGRGGLKSSFISLEIILGMMKNKEANAVIFRKYGVILRESVYEQVLWAIDVLGVSHLWETEVVVLRPLFCVSVYLKGSYGENSYR